MKKTNKFFSVLILLAMLLPLLPAYVRAAVKEPTEAFYVNDFAGVLSDSTKKYIVNMNEGLVDTGAEFVVVTVDFIDGEDTYDYAYNTFNTWGVGDAQKNNGFLLLLAIAEDDYAIALGAGAEKIIDSGKAWVVLQDYLEEDFDNEDFDSGVLKTAEAFNHIITDYYDVENQGSTAFENTASNEGLLTNELTAQNARFINDDAGVLKDSTIKSLTAKNERLWEMNGGQIAVVTVNTVGGADIADYTINLFNTLGVGDAENNNGVLMLLSIDDNDYYFALGDGLAARVRESEFSSLLDNNFKPDFQKGRYDRAVSNTFDKIYDLIAELYGDDTAGYVPGAVMPAHNNYNQYGGGSFARTMGDLISSIVGLIIVVAIIFVMISMFSRPRHTTVVGVPRRRFFFFPYPRRRYYGPYWGPGRGHAPPPPPQAPRRPVNNPGPATAAKPQRTKQPNSIFGGGSSSTGMGKSGKASTGSSSGSGFGSSGASRGGGATRSGGSSFGGGATRSGGSSFGGGASRGGGGMSRGGGASRGGGGMSRGGGASRGGKR